MQELILGFLVLVNCYLNEAAKADDLSSPTLGVNKNFGHLNGAHLTFAVAHVNI